MSKFGFSIFRPNQPTCFQSSSTLLVELLMDLCFFRLAEAFKTCFGLIFTFEPSVSWLSISIFIYIYIYLFTLYDDNPQLSPTTLGPFRGSKIQAPSVFSRYSRRRAARVCARVASGLDVWRGQQFSMLLMYIYICTIYTYIYIHMCVCVLYMLSVYTILYIYFAL